MASMPRWLEVQREATMVLDEIARLRRADRPRRDPRLEERAQDLVTAAVRVDPRPESAVWRSGGEPGLG